MRRGICGERYTCIRLDVRYSGSFCAYRANTFFSISNVAFFSDMATACVTYAAHSLLRSFLVISLHPANLSTQISLKHCVSCSMSSLLSAYNFSIIAGFTGSTRCTTKPPVITSKPQAHHAYPLSSFTELTYLKVRVEPEQIYITYESDLSIVSICSCMSLCSTAHPNLPFPPPYLPSGPFRCASNTADFPLSTLSIASGSSLPSSSAVLAWPAHISPPDAAFAIPE